MYLGIVIIYQQLHLIDRRKYTYGNYSEVVGKMRSIIRKLENKLAEEAKLQKEKKESKKDKTSR